MALTLNTTKSSATLKMCLAKKQVVTPPEINVAFLMDVSGSFEDEHLSGVTNDLMTKLFPWALVFDPDKKMEFYTFSHEDKVEHVGDVTAYNCLDYIRKNVIKKVVGWNGGTDYSYALEKVLTDFGWIAEPDTRGFFGKLFGKKLEVKKKIKSLVFLITDGENSDKKKTRNVLTDSYNRGDDVYFMFVGVSNNGDSFSFIQELGEEFNNVGFVKISDIDKFVNMDDESINDMFITDEFIKYVNK